MVIRWKAIKSRKLLKNRSDYSKVRKNRDCIGRIQKVFETGETGNNRECGPHGMCKKTQNKSEFY